jgi:hypothetical protein
VEIDLKKQELSYNKLADALGLKRLELENQTMEKQGSGWNSPMSQLLEVAKAWCVDNERTITSDPVLKSIWEDYELEEIKSLIMKKVRKL